MWEALKRLYHRMGSPKWFYEISGRWLPWFAIPAALFMIIGTVWGLAFAPADYQQGNSFRIIYIHVPAAILAQSAYAMMAIAGGIYLIWRMKMAAWVAAAIAPIGASFCFIALITGAIWGKPTWGTWWVWDARLTSTLILFFLYAGIIGLYSSIDNKQKGDRAASLISVVGVIIIPVIKKSVDWWQTLHQPSTFTITSAPSMTPDMYLPLLICVIGFYSILLSMLLNRLRAEILIRERNTSWVQQYLNNQVRE